MILQTTTRGREAWVFLSSPLCPGVGSVLRPLSGLALSLLQKVLLAPDVAKIRFPFHALLLKPDDDTRSDQGNSAQLLLWGHILEWVGHIRADDTGSRRPYRNKFDKGSCHSCFRVPRAAWAGLALLPEQIDRELDNLSGTAESGLSLVWFARWQ